MDQHRQLLSAIQLKMPYKLQAKPATSTHMSSSPAEIKRMIAFHLRDCKENPDGPRDIKSFRLVNKEFSAIGAEFLLPVIHLTFQTKSFERLRTISQHPFYSQRVTHLQYEPDAFGKVYRNEEDWITGILNFKSSCESEHRVKLQAMRESGAKFGYERNAAHCELRKFFNAYRAVDYDQIKIRHQLDAYNSSLIAQAIARLPNLVEVTLSFESAMITQPNPFRRAYNDVFFPPTGDNCHIYPYGVMQLYSVLSGVVSAGIQLKTLNCGKIDWRLLQMDKNKIKIIKRAIKHLENLQVMFYAGAGYLEGDALEAEIQECGTFLVGYPMCKFLSAAQDLKTLSLYIDRSAGIGLEYMVGNTTWASLRVLELDCIIAAQDILIHLLQRHGGTLKELSLNNLVLITGGWPSAISTIRNVVKLKDFRAVGTWTTNEPLQHWTIDTSTHSQGLPMTRLSPPCRLGMAIKEYVLEFGRECPLLDPITYPSW